MEDKVKYQKTPYSNEKIKQSFHPYVKKWWNKNFQGFTPPQKYSIFNIHSRINTLISSPTGSGKTLSAFTSVINELVTLAAQNQLEDRVYAVYISPLKALGNDIEKNLKKPLQEINKIHKEKTGKDLGIRIGVRTGDTTQKEKRDMTKNPPHIYITTPESFAITITTKKFILNFTNIDWIIVDEIHALADNKRGVHLSLSLERMQAHTNFCRVGLSATVSPLKEVAKFLVGYDDYKTKTLRPCEIVDVSHAKNLDMSVISPVENMIETDHNVTFDKMYKILDEYIQKSTTTLIFTNTRSGTERVVHHLKQKYPKNYERLDEDDKQGESLIGAHHGSLSQTHRKMVEDKLKKGELKAVVSSTSLELGIDIGYIDMVVLLGSPKSVARALQRIGRSGHKLNEVSVGKIIVTDRDDLVECSVLLKSSLENKIDRIQIPTKVYDVLSQQIYGQVIEGKKRIEEVYATAKRSYCFIDMSRKDFDDVLKYLRGEYGKLEERHVYAKIWVDEEKGLMGKRGRLARMIYMTNVGTIPDASSVKVKLDGNYIGSISEAFLENLKKGDVFVLGGDTYEFRYSQGMTAFVKDSGNRAPTVPSWFSEQLPLSFDLAMEIQKLRRYVEQHFDMKSSEEDIKEYLKNYLHIDGFALTSLYKYFKEQYLFSEIPHDKKIVVERLKQEGKYYTIFHSLFGRRVNDVLSRAVGFVASKIYKVDIEINISDNGFYLMTKKKQNINVQRIFKTLMQEDLHRVMKNALKKTEVLKRRFRHCAARSLMILRNYKGRNKSVSRQQLSSRLLISMVRRLDDDFVILREARREVLEDLMDIKNARGVLQGIEEGEISVIDYVTSIPSPFSFNLISMGYTDIMKMDDKQAFLKRMHEYVLADIGLKKGKRV